MKRGERRCRTEKVVSRRKRDWQVATGPHPGNAPRDIRKRHPLDCGNPECGVCRADPKSHRKDVQRKLPLEDE